MSRSIALFLLGFVGIYRGWWNLTFGAQDWRGFLIVVLGSVSFLYGLNGILLWSVS